MFDLIQFLEQHRIEYKTSGANVGRGNLTIHCPYCGAADESYHLSVSLEGLGFRCWREHQHRGSITKLVKELTGCSWEHAKQITGQQSINLTNDFASQVQACFQTPVIENTNLKLPPEFKPLSNLPSCRPFLNYLKKRGFSLHDLDGFNLQYATRGLFAGRIIFPIYFKHKLVAWTGRTIHKSVELRYKAEGPTTQYLLWHDDILKTDAETIYLCEGPIDSLKMNVLGNKYGICSTCFFTSGPSVAQIDLLYELLPKFKYRFLLLDQGTVNIAGPLNSLKVVIKQLPSGIKDPGILNAKQFSNLFLE